MILLRGPSGIGKSRLLRELAQVARADGWTTIHTAPVDDQTRYGPLSRWLNELGAAPARSYSTAGRRLERALRGAGPVCLLVDDLPQADPLSLFALRYLGAGLLSRPVLVIAAANSDQDDPDGLVGLQAEGRSAEWLETHEVDGMTRADIGRLGASLLGSPLPPGALEYLYRLTEGNPLHAIGLLHLWSQVEALGPGPSGWEWQVVMETEAHRAMLFGAVLRAAGRPAEALPWLDRSLALRGHPFVERYYLAHAQVERALHELGRQAEARLAWQRARRDLTRLGAEPGLVAAEQRWAAASQGIYR